MNLPRVPQILVGGFAVLPELFFASAKWRGAGRRHVEEVVGLAPEPIRNLTCFLDRLTGRWRYDYGEPFVGLPNGEMIFGTKMYHEVDRLFEVLECAQRRLEPEKLASYLQRLADPRKHGDVLAEFAPILRLDSTVQADYEVPGYGEGNTTVDWRIHGDGFLLLLDVKNRARDLFESLALLQVGERGPGDTVPAPIHDPGLLFRSLDRKFKSRKPSKIVQAAWIVSGIKQEEDELSKAFANLDGSRVHVAILGDWNDDVYVLGNNTQAKKRVVQLLRVRESRRFVFRREHG